MRRVVGLLLMVMLIGGCVDGTDPSNGAVRILNAVPDAPRMSLSLDGQLRATNIDYASASAYAAALASDYRMRIDELVVTGANPVIKTIYDESVELNVNDEISFIVVGEALEGSEEVVAIRTRTRGVPTGKTRLQVVHAAVGAEPVDVYVTAPDALVTASAPFAQALAYKAHTPQEEINGGSAKIVLTAPNDPDAVLFDSGSIFLTLEGTLLVAVVPNIGSDAGERSFLLVVMTGAGSTVLLDRSTRGAVRAVNAAPGSYALDVFVNTGAVNATARQDCDPLSEETDTLLELCGLAFGEITPFSAIVPASYGVKIQKAAAPAVAAQTFGLGLTGGSRTSLVLTGLTANDSTTTTQSLLTLNSTRRITTTAQLRITNASLAADATVAGDPLTDRLDLFITAPGEPLAGKSANFINLRLGSDTGYVPFAAGSYQVTLARVDTAAPAGTEPEALFTREIAMVNGGLYTLVIIDSAGGVQPLGSLSLEDDPTP